MGSRNHINSLSFWERVRVRGVKYIKISKKPVSTIGIGKKLETAGFSFLEMMLALVVGAVIMAAMYSSYFMVSEQYTKISALSQIQENGNQTLNIISRDIRMAGYTAVDESTMQSTYGTITDAIEITDSGNSCCDIVSITYDKSLTLRQRITYYVSGRTNPERNALYMDVEEWNGSSWVYSINAALVTDYVDDFQVEGSENDSNGNPALVDIGLIIHDKYQLMQEQSYEKPSYAVGNYAFTANDRFIHDEFNATIRVRNVR